MLRSMTGFGAGAAEGAGIAIRVELRAVNHRFLQAKVRLPGDLLALEGAVEAAIKERLTRGSISVTVRLEAAASSGGVQIDRELARRYADALMQLSGELGLEEGFDVSRLVSLPGVLQSGPLTADDDELRPLVMAALDQALAALISMRETEGAALAADLAVHAGALGEIRAKIAAASPEVVRRHQQTLHERVQALLGPERPVEERDLARELALIADRADVSEEISRLEMHLVQLDKLCAQGGAVGRKLDFLVQELLREVNTIGSKCNDAQIAHWVVDAKTHVERLREQVQNVE
ncbi:YicC/YloC family endoribonuclease [Engelhardtia mirabilis]|uniref:YicC-like family, N-terminal region n=1 Tax=Engelhardtia mirabilis TaxID=2528011 RepID=A0A518BRV4_9BACT|nr:Conserved hypothetical protein CHP00255 [Planctomycetes bacterium Pla133]QDV04022.1 Conserved hypothetical protein CHP00255 [Planctomycetes bacterium Pla86]